MNKERQTVKRRIFISNTCMVFVTLSLFLIVNMCMMKLYERSYSSIAISSSKLADGAEIAKSYMSEWNSPSDKYSIDSFALKLKPIGYSLCVVKDRTLIYSNTDYSVDKILDEMELYVSQDEEVHTYVQNSMTILTKYDKDKNIKVYVTAGKYMEYWSQKNSFTTFLTLFLIDGILCIGALLLMSQVFTKRLTKHILQPLEALSDGAQRMKSGNLMQPVEYHGDIEFENVCDTFNEMQKHIQESKAKQDAYEKARIEMVAGISHDLRTPLTAIRGTIKGLRDGVAATSEIREKFLDTAYKRTIDMDNLLERLFYFSKLETGNMPLFMEETEWNDYLVDYIKSREVSLNEKNVKLVFKGIKDRIWSPIDRDQMKRILDNLLENSMKYSETEELKLCIELGKTVSYAVITVSDNGCGVPEEKIAHIFRQFYRCDESRNKKEGNGLGLYIVKYLIEYMGGAVKAENNNGLQIQIQLPIVDKGVKRDG